MKITDRDSLILKTLTTKVRTLSGHQIASTFFNHDYANAGRRLDQLVDRQFLARFRLIARIIDPPIAPVYLWEPGFSAPSFERFSRRLKERWQVLPTKRVTIYLATARLSGTLGKRLKGRLTHPLQVSHDLGLASVYLRLATSNPRAADFWIGEDAFQKPRSRGKAVFDAMLQVDGHPTKAIEFGGVYTAMRLQRLHLYCFAREMAYEVW